MRGWQALVLVLIAGTIGLATGSRAIEMAALALVALLLIGGGYRLLLTGDVGGVREVSDSIVSWGGTLSQKVTLTNRSRLTIPAIRITDQSTLPDHPHGYVTALRARRTIAWDIDIPCQTRGRYRLGPVEAHMSDPLGLFPVRRQVGAASSVLVLPRWVPLKRTALKLDGFMPGEARGKRRGESPPTVVSVREYSSGDSVSAIHWPASARAGQLMTKLFDPQIQTTLWLALDLDGDLPLAVEELLVTVTTSIAMYALQQANLRVGVVASGDVAIKAPSERGRPHQYRLQELLAEVRSGGETKLSDQLARLDAQLGPGQVVALVTSRGPEVWGTWLERLFRRGVATRVVRIQEGDDESVGDGEATWSSPSVRVPLSMGDPAQEDALISRLEGRHLVVR
jgi:uncharacterized protein (DUF58 family)